MYQPLVGSTGRKVSWRDGIVIAAVVGLAKADAASVGVVAPALEHHLHINDTQLGLLASISSGTGALCALPAGTLVDRRRRILVVTVSLVAWSLALGVAGFATGIVILAGARLVSGGVATIARPITVSLVADIYDPLHRGRALAALDTGQAMGTALCFLAGSLAVKLLDWRWLFWWLAGAGLILAFLASRVQEPGAPRAPGPPLRQVIASLLRIPTNLVVLLSDSVGNFFFAGAGSFAVLFFTERYRMSNAFVDALAPVFAVGVIAGILLGGSLGDRLTRTRGGGRRIVLAVACQLVATAIFGVALLAPSLYVTGFCLFAGATVLGGAGPCLDAVRVDIVGPEIRGRAEAARGLLTLASSALGPVTFGMVATAFGGRSHGLALRDAFLVMLVPLAVGALILLIGLRYYDADAIAAGSEAGPGMLSG